MPKKPSNEALKNAYDAVSEQRDFGKESLMLIVSEADAGNSVAKNYLDSLETEHDVNPYDAFLPTALPG
jgi:hypothetical protein